jgi:hypothetical protein
LPGVSESFLIFLVKVPPGTLLLMALFLVALLLVALVLVAFTLVALLLVALFFLTIILVALVFAPPFAFVGVLSLVFPLVRSPPLFFGVAFSFPTPAFFAAFVPFTTVGLAARSGVWWIE